MSKYSQYTAKEIYPHKHCPVCNKMIPEDEDYCSDECAGYTKKKDGNRKKKIIGFVVLYVVIIGIFIGVAFFSP